MIWGFFVVNTVQWEEINKKAKDYLSTYTRSGILKLHVVCTKQEVSVGMWNIDKHKHGLIF